MVDAEFPIEDEPDGERFIPDGIFISFFISLASTLAGEKQFQATIYYERCDLARGS